MADYIQYISDFLILFLILFGTLLEILCVQYFILSFIEIIICPILKFKFIRFR